MPESAFLFPTLHHPESQLLYTEGLKWNTEQLQEVLNLPRLTLIADLETILADTKERFSYYETLLEAEENISLQDAPLNAIMLLAEIKAVESLPVILNWLTASMDFIDFWVGDHITETIWEPLYKLLPGPADPIESFLKNREAYEFARGAMNSALAQLVMHQPEQRSYVLSIFQNVFDYYLQLPDEVDETLFVGMAIHEAEDIEAIELWPVIEKLFDAERVDEFAAGTKAEALKELQQPTRPGYYFREVLPMEERYQKITTTWYGYTGKEGSFIDNPAFSADDDWADWEEDDDTVQMPVVRTDPKIGRNDPCPCGSGKKYKKCCLGKLEG